MQIRLFATFVVILLFCFSLSHCSFIKSNPQVVADLTNIQTTETGWYVTLSNTPIDNISITNDHAFGSTDYGLLHFFPLRNDPTGELLFPVASERCLNHFVGSGTDTNGTPMSRYFFIDKHSLKSKDLYCSKDEKEVVSKNVHSLSLSKYPTFSDGSIKLRFNSDVSSQTTALAAYTDLLFITKDRAIRSLSLDNPVYQSYLVGSSYYYLSKSNNPPFIQFHSLKTLSPSSSWSFQPKESSFDTSETLIDASFSKILQRFFVCFRFESSNSRSITIQSFDTDGSQRQERVLTNSVQGSMPTSSIHSFFVDKKILLVGELFQKGEIVCIDTTDFQVVWTFTEEHGRSPLDMIVDTTHQTLYVLLSNGQLTSFDLETGRLMQTNHIGPELEDIVYSKGSIHLFQEGITGCLNNTIARPFRSMFFYQSLMSE
ncbi:MAG: hypothetical protein PHX86_02470 [Caldisericia bacterium]|nr:hypothetical protein [Caldisericia bacterium]